jgi:uncharacterized phiE125 gp8 family phage protein
MSTYGLTLTTAPTGEPVTLSEVKFGCGIAQDLTYHDNKIVSYITAARRRLEDRTGRTFYTQTWDMTLDTWPRGLDPIYLPKVPLASVTHVKYYDTSNVQQTLSTNVYQVLADREPGEIRLKYAQSWPFLYSQDAVISIRFVCGQAVASIPQAAKQAILLDVWSMYDPAVDNSRAYDALAQSLMVGDEFHCYSHTY